MNKFIFFVFCLILFINPLSFAVDEADDLSLLPENIEKPYVHDKYNYEGTDKVTVKLKLVSCDISTKKGSGYEGQKLDLRVKQNVKYKGKIIIKGDTPATGIVSNIRTHGMNGIPAAIIIDNIQIDGVDRDKLTSNYTERGVNLSLLVFPLKWALTPLPPTGSLTNFILGGHAKIDKNTVIKVDYYPEWSKDL